jgi:regulator of protease activity HflC (stomatin/prohibitin superfamily)
MLDLAGNTLGIALLALLALVTFWVFWLLPRMKTINVFEWTWAVSFRGGRYDKVLSPGRHHLFGKEISTIILDRRAQLLVIQGQEVLTKDGLGLKLSVVVQYKIEDPIRFVRTVVQADVGGGTGHLYNLAQLPIRTAVQSATLDEILTNRDAIPEAVASVLREQFKPLGLGHVEVSIRDIMLPREIRDAFAAPAIAQKQGQAALERARGEVSSLRALANAARIARDNPELLKLRALQQSDAARQTLVLDLGRSGDASAGKAPLDLTDDA